MAAWLSVRGTLGVTRARTESQHRNDAGKHRLSALCSPFRLEPRASPFGVVITRVDRHQILHSRRHPGCQPCSGEGQPGRSNSNDPIPNARTLAVPHRVRESAMVSRRAEANARRVMLRRHSARALHHASRKRCRRPLRLAGGDVHKRVPARPACHDPPNPIKQGGPPTDARRACPPRRRGASFRESAL
jgi:hypothetical protein